MDLYPMAVVADQVQDILHHGPDLVKHDLLKSAIEFGTIGFILFQKRFVRTDDLVQLFCIGSQSYIKNSRHKLGYRFYSETNKTSESIVHTIPLSSINKLFTRLFW